MKNNNDPFAANLLSALRDLLKYWYLIVISLAIALAIAVFYLKYAAKTYKVQASVQLNIEQRNNAPGNPGDILMAFDFMVQDKNFNNEIAFLQSSPLVRDVVNEMELRTSYFMKEDKIPLEFKFALNNIYKETPFIVIPDEDHIQPVYMHFYIRIIDEEKYGISAIYDGVSVINLKNEQIVSNNVNFYLDGIYKFGDPVETPYSKFTILLNSNYNPGKYDGKDLFFQFNKLDWMAKSFKNSLTVETSAFESTMATLIFTTDNIHKGTDFLSALIGKFVDRNLEEANFLANKTIEYIDNQLVNISDSLGISEQQLQSLRSSYSVMNIDEKAQNLYGQLQTLQTMRDESQRRLNYLQQINDYFLQNRDSTQLMAPSAMGLNDPLLNNLIQELTALNSEKKRIISQDQLRNPRLETIDISIENLKQVITENLSFSISTTRRELDEMIQKITELNTEFNRLPSTQRQLLGIERKFNLNDAVYTSLLERRIQSQIIKASRLPDLKVIEPPSYMSVAAPGQMMIMLMAVFLGFLFPTLFILGKRLIMNKLYHIDEIKAITDISHIGVIPNSAKPMHNVVFNYPLTPITEAFHALRSNLVYYLYGKKHKIILVTSSTPGEGKSFTAINLATSFALTNSRTLLIEFDLRRPSKILESFRVESKPGVSAYLINYAELPEIIIPTEIPNLDIIQAGEIPPNPIELISSDKTTELIAELKETYDYI
ncbi:MAG: polysaccharide biosynthesis tyrosine autokinase, partial [Bacteroidales bacterium]|nr:polysaccharide biosynthesis tyrosine autokinase [Bacteroidales bacterium]